MKENQRLAQETLAKASVQDLLHQLDLNPKGLRLDYFLEPSFLVFQQPKQFCFNADSAALAQFIHFRPGARVLEIGTNNGAILAYLSRYSPSFLCGVEILKEPAKLAALNMQRLVPPDISWQVFQGPIQAYDLKEKPSEKKEENQEKSQGLTDFKPLIYGDLKPNEGPFDVVLCNPPYFALESSRHEETLSLRQLARFEQNLDLRVMIQEASRLLRSYGRFFFVHRPNRLVESLGVLHDFGFGVSRLQIVYDQRDNEAKAFLIEAIKEGRCEPKILPPLFRQ